MYAVEGKKKVRTWENIWRRIWERRKIQSSEIDKKGCKMIQKRKIRRPNVEHTTL